jgi:hypothetical protein
MFVHQTFPAQFGHIADYLVHSQRFRCTFVSQLPPGMSNGVERIQYVLKGGATEATHYCSQSFENAIWHSHAIFDALKARPDVRPDLIVGHSGYLSTAFLRELYDCPIVNYFEYYYHTTGADMDFRHDFPFVPISFCRNTFADAARGVVFHHRPSRLSHRAVCAFVVADECFGVRRDHPRIGHGAGA